MNTEQKKKMRFVDRRLQPLMQAASENEVSSLLYKVIGAEELVVVRFHNGYEKSVCVTGDSLAAIARDCLKAI